MKRPQLVSPGSLSRMLQGADEAWNRRDIQQCFDLFERAARLEPANPGILIRLGRVRGLYYDYTAAESCFDKAIRVSTQKTETITRIAKIAVEFANHDLAERYYHHALDRPDVNSEAIVGLAELYERLSKLEEARKLVDRALGMDPGCGPALLVRARLDRRARRLEAAEQSVRTILVAPDRELRIRANYELGMILDSQGRYDEAMAAFLEAKGMLRPDAASLLSQLAIEHEQMKSRRAAISSEVLKKWLDAGAGLLPARRIAFLGGHPRSGTTMIEQVLDSHPGMVSAEETEIFTDEAFYPLRSKGPSKASMFEILEGAPVTSVGESRTRYFLGMERYLGRGIGERMLIDKNPRMNLFIPAYLRVFPEIKLLIALRDPRDVCLSCFMQTYVPVRIGSASYLSLETVTESYALKMGLWRELATKLVSPYLEFKYEDAVEDLELVARRMLEFLGVPWDPTVLQFNVHAQQKMIRTPSYADVTKPVFKTAVGRWRHYQKYFEPHLATLEPLVKAFGYE